MNVAITKSRYLVERTESKKMQCLEFIRKVMPGCAVDFTNGVMPQEVSTECSLLMSYVRDMAAEIAAWRCLFAGRCGKSDGCEHARNVPYNPGIFKVWLKNENTNYSTTYIMRYTYADPD